MFSTSGTSSEDAPPADAPPVAGPPESAGLEAARAFDQALRDLRPPGAPEHAPDVASVAAAATEHAETLRATRDARQEAQEILALATEARKTASEEAERIVLEARDAAERTRQELAGWAAAQRAKVDALVSDMVESANRDADAIRADALRTAMADAEEAARRHVAEALEAAERDAESIRAEARSVLSRAVELGGEAEEAIFDLTSTVPDIVTRIQATRAAMHQVLSEHRPSGTDDDAEGRGAEGRGAEERGAEETEAGEDAPAGEDEPADDLEDPTDPGTGDDVVASDAGLGEAEEPDQPAEADLPDDEEPDPGADAALDRQLGAIFRRYGHGG